MSIFTKMANKTEMPAGKKYVREFMYKRVPLKWKILLLYILSIALTVKLHLSNTTESNISHNNEWMSFQLSLFICAMYSTD